MAAGVAYEATIQSMDRWLCYPNLEGAVGMGDFHNECVWVVGNAEADMRKQDALHTMHSNTGGVLLILGCCQEGFLQPKSTGKLTGNSSTARRPAPPIQ